jgi:hypothetical protein
MITPSDSPSAPEQYATVPVAGADIQAPQADLTGVFGAANAASGAGVLYPQSPRQAQTEALLSSPAGFGEFDVTAGYSGGGGEDWPGNVEPGG